MNEDQFWQIIQTAKQAASDDDQQLEGISMALQTLQVEEILEFQRVFDRLYYGSYRADLWGAAFIIGGGCSDDGFDYFRGWLIAQGKGVYAAALENPDSLDMVCVEAAKSNSRHRLEGMLGVAGQVWKEKTGLGWDEFFEKKGKQNRVPTEFGDFNQWSDGRNADPIKCKVVYPRLWARFGG